MTTWKIAVFLATYSTISSSCNVPISSESEIKEGILRKFSSSWGSEHRSDIVKTINTGFTENTILSRQPIDQLKDVLVPLAKSVLGGKLIFPGTKWCGDGNIAENYNDLGVFEGTDRCCRSHDICKPSIDVGETACGLTNNGFLTKKYCECDLQFSSCLSREKSNVSTMVGLMYFNFLQNKCYTNNQTCYVNSASNGIRDTEPNNIQCRFCDALPFETDINLLDALEYLLNFINKDK